ncbi:hypothetical protein BT69DRAFT_1284863, partial [Atractiella rhizophila]
PCLKNKKKQGELYSHRVTEPGKPMTAHVGQHEGEDEKRRWQVSRMVRRTIGYFSAVGYEVPKQGRRDD